MAKISKKPAHVSVHIKETRGNVDRLIRKFIKKTKKERIVERCREKEYYKKPSVRKKEKRQKAVRARKREEQKRIRAQQRRNRKE